MHDAIIINGLTSDYQQRARFEKKLYLLYQYFIQEGCRKYRLTYEDSFSAYSDAVLSAIHNILNGRFDNTFSLKTYLFQIFHNKCVDIIRKISNNKQRVNQSAITPELLGHLPETTKNIIEKLIDQERISVIMKYLESIGEKCKEILMLFEDGYSDRDIADKLAYNNAAVAKTTRLRCREKIKNLFTSHE
ncbi:MAG: sigma-70 family RNA polymerase sigma factor [Chitinophagaceae bacterium]